MIQIKLLHENATAPIKGSTHSAGFDLFSCEHKVITPGERVVVKTGVAMSLPKGRVGLIWPRSGMAVRHGIDTLAGVIDADYRGEIGVVLINHGYAGVDILEGTRIAQLVVQSVWDVPMVVVPELTDTDRGEGGFGSTGE